MPLDSFRLLSSEPHISLTAFNSPDQVPGGYAVVSHVWRATEPSLREVQQLADQEATYDDSRLDDKIRQCCILTRARGLPYFWIDSPCIDQRNSTELSEAISSMYAWYAKAAVCFAHLPDVPSDDCIFDPSSAFRRSVYFTRSWTLQELIAPKRVVFVSSDWTVLGEKQDLAELLEEITNIDRQILTFCRPLTDVSIACKLSWAARRNARRIEDRAYSLLGLFDIHMPMMYGEGEKAFARLLHTILKEKCDHTALAWGRATDLPLSHPPSLTPLLRGCDPKPVSQQATPVCPPSPAAFVDSAHLTPVDIEEFMSTMATWGASPTGDNKARTPLFWLVSALSFRADGTTLAPLSPWHYILEDPSIFGMVSAPWGGLHGPALEEDPPRLFRIPASGPNAGLRGFNRGLLFWRRRRTYTVCFKSFHIATASPTAATDLPFFGPPQDQSGLAETLYTSFRKTLSHLQTPPGRQRFVLTDRDIRLPGFEHPDRSPVSRAPLWFRKALDQWCCGIRRWQIATGADKPSDTEVIEETSSAIG
ncbi:hypothetical protein ONZ51_g8187 [Trametes cubensis]|uniref:Heterokaryon incompatibility domain-containing protein n=1 Tax=Trametes cubensis TaxID=1111947 RepID=A0AAD7TP68_9APHY|nr:hypothetical protein ONZ51_g8187 [Trametes cubensis]